MGRRGGQLSVPIEVDAATGKLLSIEAVNKALDAVVSAYNANDDLPGDFEVESRNGVFFVMPVRYRDASGATQPMTPILSTPITLPEETRSVRQTLRLIRDHVYAATGVEITPNIRSVVARDVTIGAQDEPAGHLIARLLATRNGGVPAANASWDSSFSYLLLCNNRTGCVLNDWRSRPTDTGPRTPRPRYPQPPIIPPGQGTK
jgi:hypothetical protein